MAGSGSPAPRPAASADRTLAARQAWDRAAPARRTFAFRRRLVLIAAIPARLRHGVLLVAVSMRIGTRKSTMALAQTEDIAQRLSVAAPELGVEIVKFETSGDTDQTSKLLVHGGKGGAFVAEIRAAVVAGRLHAAMHSLKDMPGNEDTPGLVIGATLARDPPTDALVLRPGVTMEDIRRTRGKGFKVGTNAVRRAAYLRRLFPEIEVTPYRGAAHTRVRNLATAEMQRLPN